MMDSRRHVLEQIELFLDQELPDSDQEVIEEHLRSCQVCATELEVARAIRRDLRSLPLQDASPALVEKLKAIPFDNAVGSPPPQNGSRWRTLGAIAAVMGLVAVGLRLTGAPPEPPPPTPLEIARAEQEARYTFALIAQLTRKAGERTRSEIEPERLLLPVRKRVEDSLQLIRRSVKPPENG